MYDYRNEMRKDIINAIAEEMRYDESILDLGRCDLEERLNDTLWADDSVTGNGSGSYFFSSSKALEAIADGNGNLISDLIEEFDLSTDTIANHFTDWEYWDVSIRCYLLGDVISSVLDEIESIIEENEGTTFIYAVEILKAA